MKKNINLIWIIIFSVASIPVIASCPITGACSPVNYPDFSNSSTLEDKYIPNNLQNMTNPQNEFIQNNESLPPVPSSGLNNPSDSSFQPPSEKPYNASCQFGTCLP